MTSDAEDLKILEDLKSRLDSLTKLRYEKEVTHGGQCFRIIVNLYEAFYQLNYASIKAAEFLKMKEENANRIHQP